MKNLLLTTKSEVESLPAKKYPLGSARFDWIVTALSVWVITRYFLVGWAFSHGKSDYVSPVSWAAPAYSGLLALLLFLFLTQWRNRTKGYAWRQALSAAGYFLGRSSYR